jgi:hypothetical protein
MGNCFVGVTFIKKEDGFYAISAFSTSSLM